MELCSSFSTKPCSSVHYMCSVRAIHASMLHTVQICTMIHVIIMRSSLWTHIISCSKSCIFCHYVIPLRHPSCVHTWFYVFFAFTCIDAFRSYHNHVVSHIFIMFSCDNTLAHLHITTMIYRLHVHRCISIFSHAFQSMYI